MIESGKYLKNAASSERRNINCLSLGGEVFLWNVNPVGWRYSRSKNNLLSEIKVFDGKNWLWMAHADPLPAGAWCQDPPWLHGAWCQDAQYLFLLSFLRRLKLTREYTRATLHGPGPALTHNAARVIGNNRRFSREWSWQSWHDNCHDANYSRGERRQLLVLSNCEISANYPRYLCLVMPRDARGQETFK